ncbi:hypothetical protein FGK63_07255 [Ruegeria sediminis]|uniref:PepSY domain-containing protein n=1 Tax=Ruegeria sediminis TaxID=2583820 RepID=A0ABY2X242_9RHOB|nr:hypothetical protein [Ruegeria sediminis]TMV08909.1 hypothetical protein FGK63_07255 [Ruegeria sediminis]
MKLLPGSIPCLVGAMALSGCDTPAPSASLPPVGTATDLTAYQGEPAAQLETSIRALGYERVRTNDTTAFWFNRETGACARIETNEGRYTAIDMLPAQDC